MKWIEADYFSDFKCKCGDCRSSCCDAWEIAVSESEFHRLSNLTCSDNLYRRIQCAFRVIDNPTPERYRLFARNFIGCCPMHDESGLCSLQVELGEKILPEICRVFPRSMHRKGGKNRAVCSAGCEAVIELLDRDASLSFIEKEADHPVDLTQDALPGFFDNFVILSDMLRDQHFTIGERINHICSRLMPSFAPKSDIAAGLETLLNAIDALKAYSPTLCDFADSIGDRYRNIENYYEDRTDFEKNFPNAEQLFENLFLNHLLYEDFPETDPRIKPEDSVYGICFAYALARLMCIHAHDRGKDGIADALTSAFRYIEHTSIYYNARVVIACPETLNYI